MNELNSTSVVENPYEQIRRDREDKHGGVAIVHFTAPPVVGGVEAVIHAHSRIFRRFGYPVTIIAGRGQIEALPFGVDFIHFPELDSQAPQLAQFNLELENGRLPEGFEDFTQNLVTKLIPVLQPFEIVIFHNIFTKHFNLPFTAAVYRLLDKGVIQHCIAWCHDFTWTSPNSSSKVYPGYPWDLLRTYRRDVDYVTVSADRQSDLAELFGVPLQTVKVIYNGVEPAELLGLSEPGLDLINRLGLFESDLVLLMPIRVTQAKNIEFALEVVAALKDRGCSPKLVVTGPPDPHDEQSMVYFQSLLDLRDQLGVTQEMSFVFEAGPEMEQAYIIDPLVVGDLFRVSDLMFMPSHREGFGMPVLEAGLAGLPVVCAEVPAALEIGEEDVSLIDPAAGARQVADQILIWVEGRPIQRLKRRVRQMYTWQAIFRRDIEPLLRKEEMNGNSRTDDAGEATGQGGPALAFPGL
jgi:glycosyltransferase involved in cell wall biosynthesis